MSCFTIKSLYRINVDILHKELAKYLGMQIQNPPKAEEIINGAFLIGSWNS